MLENNSNRLIFAAIAVVVGVAIAGKAHAAFPQATNTLVEKVKSFTDDKDYSKLSYSYNDSNKTATVTGFASGQFNSNLVVPKTTEKDGTSYTVTGIGVKAFQSDNDSSPAKKSHISSIDLPNTITTIGDSAFYGNEINNIVLPSSITSIGNYAFAYNRSTQLSLPEHLNSMGNNAFSNNKISDIVIPNSLSTIPNSAFAYNSSNSVTIPNSVTQIGDFAFDSLSATNVVIPDSVVKIGTGSFQDNDKLTSLYISNKLTEISESAFNGSTSLQKVDIPNSVTKIDNYAFYNHNINKYTVNMSKNTTSIGKDAFSYYSFSSFDTLDTLNDKGIYNFNGSKPTIDSSAFLLYDRNGDSKKSNGIFNN